MLTDDMRGKMHDGAGSRVAHEGEKRGGHIVGDDWQDGRNGEGAEIRRSGKKLIPGR